MLNTLDRLLIYTDGLNTIGDGLAALSDAELQERIQRLLLLPANDDMTMLDLQCSPISSVEECLS